MKIFIGSSTEQKDFSEELCEKLRNKSYEVLPWWEKEVFLPGDYTFESLNRVCDKCDIAFFIFSSDDTVWFRGKEKGSPRDNVILEFGMFARKNGLKRTFIVTNDTDIKFPSDLNGITYMFGTGSIKERAANVISQFEVAVKEFSQKTTQKIEKNLLLHTNKDLILKLINTIPKSWGARSLYFGEKGALNWKAVETDTKYLSEQCKQTVISKIREMLNSGDVKIENIVSFGPGVGTIDSKVLSQLNKPILNYIPIDINLLLATKTAQEIYDSAPQNFVPFAIVGDFEDDMNHIGGIIKESSYSKIIYMMLGGTFGNLEHGESKFLNGLRGTMTDEDYFLLDIFTKTSDYNVNSDILYNIDKQSQSIKNFLWHGLLSNGMRVSKRKGISFYIGSDKDITSDVENVAGFRYKIKRSNKSLIYVRRYDFDSFSKYLDDIGFKIVKQQIIPETNNPVKGRALLLLQIK